MFTEPLTDRPTCLFVFLQHAWQNQPYQLVNKIYICLDFPSRLPSHVARGSMEANVGKSTLTLGELILFLYQSATSVYMEAMQILEHCRKIRGVLGGVILYNNK